MNEHEIYLIDLLRNAVDKNLQQAIKPFEEYYWSFGVDGISWDSQLDQAIHEFADGLEYFEPKREWRTYPGLYDEDELRRRILRVLALLDLH